MHTKTRAILLALFFLPSIIFCYENEEKLLFQNDGFDATWHLDFQDEKDHSSIYEWTLNGESVENWTELLTMQIIETKSSKKDFVIGWLDFIKSRCASNQWSEEIIKEDENSIYLCWSIAKSSYNEQEEWAKIIKGKTGIFLIRYTIRKNAKPNTKWINLVKSAKLVNSKTYIIKTSEEFALK